MIRTRVRNSYPSDVRIADAKVCCNLCDRQGHGKKIKRVPRPAQKAHEKQVPLAGVELPEDLERVAELRLVMLLIGLAIPGNGCNDCNETYPRGLQGRWPSEQIVEDLPWGVKPPPFHRRDSHFGGEASAVVALQQNGQEAKRKKKEKKVGFDSHSFCSAVNALWTPCRLQTSPRRAHTLD